MTPTVGKKTITRTLTSHRLVLDADAILGMLVKAGVDVPPYASVSFDVPGGGDWSNTDINISAENPITIEWTEQTSESIANDT